MTKEDLARLQGLPRPRALTGQHLQEWQAYLEWRGKMRSYEQLAVRYYGREITQQGTIEFSVRMPSRKSNGTQRTGLQMLTVPRQRFALSHQLEP